jgi:hypothetical protein
MADVRGGAQQVLGSTPEDSAVAANDRPVLTGARANATAPTAVSADGDVVFDWRDRTGRQVVVVNFPTNARSSTQGPNTTTLTATTNTALVAAPGASLSIYVTRIKASNTSATLTRVDIVEGGSAGGTDGTIVDSMALAASGGGYNDRYDPPYKLPANTALHARLGTGVTDVRVNVHFFVAAT